MNNKSLIKIIILVISFFILGLIVLDAPITKNSFLKTIYKKNCHLVYAERGYEKKLSYSGYSEEFVHYEDSFENIWNVQLYIDIDDIDTGRDTKFTLIALEDDTGTWSHKFPTGTDTAFIIDEESFRITFPENIELSGVIRYRLPVTAASGLGGGTNGSDGSELDPDKLTRPVLPDPFRGDWQEVVREFTRTLLIIAGVVVVISFILAGYLYITSAGDPEKAKIGKNAVIGSVIGLLIIFFAYSIVAFTASQVSAPLENCNQACDSRHGCSCPSGCVEPMGTAVDEGETCGGDAP